MEVISMQGAENSLFSWPPLSQFDEPIWGGFGEFDQLDQGSHLSETSNVYWYVDMDLDTEATIMSPKEGSSLGLSPFDCHEQPTMTESSGDICQGFQFSPNQASESSAESSSNKSWYYAGCSDLASVLDTTFTSSISATIHSPQLLEGPVKDYQIYDKDMIAAPLCRVLCDREDIFAGKAYTRNRDSTAVSISRDLQDIDTITGARSKDSVSPSQEGKNPMIGNVTKWRTKNNRNGEFGDDTSYGKNVTECSNDNVDSAVLASTSSFPFKCFSYLPAKKVAETHQVNQEPSDQHCSHSVEYFDYRSAKNIRNSHVSDETTMAHQNQGWQNSIDKIPKATKESYVLKEKHPHRLAGNHRSSENQAKRKLYFADVNKRSSKSFQESGRKKLQVTYPDSRDTALHTPHSSALLRTHLPSSPLHSPIAASEMSMPAFRQLFEEAKYLWGSDPTYCIPEVSTDSYHTFRALEATFPSAQGYSVDEQNKYQMSSLLHQQQEPKPGPVLLKRNYDGLPPNIEGLEMHQSQLSNNNGLLPSPLQIGICHKDFCEVVAVHENSQQSTATKNLEYEESAEVKVFQQFKNVVEKLSLQTRLMIQESLHRLAKSANERSFEMAEGTFSTNFLTTRMSRHDMQIVEAKTNHVDRWIANLLFFKQPTEPESKTC